MRNLLVLCLFVGLVAAITDLQMKQLHGIQDLLVTQPDAVLATCNIVFFSELVDYDTADQKCKNFDIGLGTNEGNLVTIDTDQKNEDLKMLLNMAYPLEQQTKKKWAKTKWVWSGLRKTQNNVGEGFQGMVYHANEWQWADGSSPKPEDVAMWLDKQPDQKSIEYGQKECREEPECYQNQMRINHEGRWDDTYKFKVHPYACDYQGKYIISPKKKSWEDAKTACTDAGLHLAKIRSNEELNEMMSAMNYFLGPHDTTLKKWDANNWLWLGGNDIEKEKKWVWEDGEEIEWDIPWIKKAGNDNSKRLMPEGQDVMALSREGKVDDSFRLNVLRPFACQCPGT